MALLTVTDSGLYCPPGDIFIDPWRPVPHAIITHGHADHARPGSRHYLAAAPSAAILRKRLGDIRLDTLDYGDSVAVNGVRISLHPAGHVLGSAQVRLEHRGEVWVVSGDYKTEPDPTCAPFEAVRCHTFVTESTFALPIYRWQPQRDVFGAINAWWRANRAVGRTSVLFAYSLGKAQRLLAGVDPSIGPIFCHGAVEAINACYRETGVALPGTRHVAAASREDVGGALVIAPPSADTPGWMRRFSAPARAIVSGWMQVRGNRRRRAAERGFVLSDHADWPGLLDSIAATGAERVFATHGFTGPLVRWLRESGMAADPLETRFEGDSVDTRHDGEDTA